MCVFIDFFVCVRAFSNCFISTFRYSSLLNPQTLKQKQCCGKEGGLWNQRTWSSPRTTTSSSLLVLTSLCLFLQTVHRNGIHRVVVRMNQKNWVKLLAKSPAHIEYSKKLELPLNYKNSRTGPSDYKLSHYIATELQCVLTGMECLKMIWPKGRFCRKAEKA